MLRAKAGDRHAFRFLYDRYAGDVHRYAYSLLQDRDAADDVVQTTFLKLIGKIDRYEPRDVPFAAWLLRVARNVALDEVRRRRAHPPAFMRGDEPPAGSAAVTPDAGFSDRTAALRAALGRLDRGEREVLLLRHLVGCSDEQIAARLGTDPEEVERTHRRARAHLRSALNRPVMPAAHPRAHRRPSVQVMQ